MARRIQRREFNPKEAVFVRKPLRDSGVLLPVGTEFDWKRSALSVRRVANLFNAGFISHEQVNIELDEEATEASAPSEPTVPTEATEASAPSEPTVPTEATEASAPSEPTVPTEATEASAPSEPTTPSAPKEPEKTAKK